MVLAKPKPIKKESKTKVRKKRTPRQILVRKLDEICREIVLLRDGSCVCPAPQSGHSSVRQAGHLITRAVMPLRWDLRNLNEQCASCNMLHEHRPHIYVGWFLDKFGESEFKALRAEGEGTANLSVNDLEYLLCQMTDILSRQKEDRSFKPRFSQRSVLTGEWRNCETTPPKQPLTEAEAK